MSHNNKLSCSLTSTFYKFLKSEKCHISYTKFRKTIKKTLTSLQKLKVTVQFETKGSGQKEIFIHMDRSEVKP